MRRQISLSYHTAADGVSECWSGSHTVLPERLAAVVLMEWTMALKSRFIFSTCAAGEGILCDRWDGLKMWSIFHLHRYSRGFYTNGWRVCKPTTFCCVHQMASQHQQGRQVSRAAIQTNWLLCHWGCSNRTLTEVTVTGQPKQLKNTACQPHPSFTAAHTIRSSIVHTSTAAWTGRPGPMQSATAAFHLSECAALLPQGQNWRASLSQHSR